MNLRRAISAVGVSTFALSGCSTSYAPKPHPRVALVMQGGTPVYIREGRVYPGGGFGGDLREAVQGNAEAEAHAKTYRTHMVVGVTTALVGVASAIGGGILYVASSSRAESERNPTTEIIGGTLALSGIAAYVTGMAFMLNAQPHLWDAINSYNDGVDPSGSLRAYGWHVPPPYAAYAPTTPMATTGAPSPDAHAGTPSPATTTASPSDATSAASPVPPAVAPAPRSDAVPNGAAPPADLDLDALEAQ